MSAVMVAGASGYLGRFLVAELLPHLPDRLGARRPGQTGSTISASSAAALRDVVERLFPTQLSHWRRHEHPQLDQRGATLSASQYKPTCLTDSAYAAKSTGFTM
jgi:hypothetical protein